ADRLPTHPQSRRHRRRGRGHRGQPPPSRVQPPGHDHTTQHRSVHRPDLLHRRPQRSHPLNDPNPGHRHHLNRRPDRPRPHRRQHDPDHPGHHRPATQLPTHTQTPTPLPTHHGHQDNQNRPREHHHVPPAHHRHTHTTTTRHLITPTLQTPLRPPTPGPV